MLVRPAQPGSLWLRVASVGVLAPFALGSIYLGGWVLVALVALGAVLSADEWDRMCGGDGVRGTVGVVHVGIVLAIAVLAGADLYGAALVVGIVGGFGVAVVAKQLGRRAVWPAAGVVYVALPVIALIWLRSDPDAGRASLFWLFAVVWATDIAGFGVGRSIGGPRLAPKISPKKTWSGLGGGLVGAVLVGVVAAWLTGDAGLVLLAVVSLGLSLVSQVGDLSESAVKRHYGVKDSGNLIPGHGGILDRIDGLLFAAPAAAVVALLNDGSALIWR